MQFTTMLAPMLGFLAITASALDNGQLCAQKK